MVWQSCLGTFRRGAVTFGEAQRGSYGWARKSRRGLAMQGLAGHGSFGGSWYGRTRYGLARFGGAVEARSGAALCGSASPDMLRQG